MGIGALSKWVISRVRIILTEVLLVAASTDPLSRGVNRNQSCPLTVVYTVMRCYNPEKPVHLFSYLLKPPPSRPVHFAILKPQTLQRVGCRCRCRGCGLESWAFGLRDSRWVGFQYMRFMTRTPKNPNFLKL